MWPRSCDSTGPTVKALEQQYMREQLRRAGTPGPRVLGLDEVSIKKGHPYRIVASDLIRHRPIWFGGTDRSEASLDQFYAWWGPRKAARIPAGRHGHVEPVSLRDRAARPAGQHPVQQVPRAAASGRRARPGPQERVRPRIRPAAPPVHQGAEVHLAGPPRDHLHAAGDLTVPSYPQVPEITHTTSRRP